MNDLAMMFPGQGSQYPRMALDVLRCPAGPRLLAEVEAISGLPMTELMSSADSDTLADPEVAQLAVLTHSLALLDQLQRDGVVPGIVGGHSLGEYTAMVAAGMMESAVAVDVVAKRGRAMAAAARGRCGTMGAIVGLSMAMINNWCDEEPREVVIANVNSPRQCVISGESPAVDAVLARAQAAGALRAKRLRVGGAYHSPLMAPAARTMADVWDDVILAPPRCTFVSSTTGAVVHDPLQQTRVMRGQVAAPVQWSAVLSAFQSAGVDAVVEVGPGRVLAGLAREQVPGIRRLPLPPGTHVGRTVPRAPRRPLVSDLAGRAS